VNAKTEIAALRPDEIMSEHLPSATDQLDAIVGSTEEATNGILQAMESLESLVGEIAAGDRRESHRCGDQGLRVLQLPGHHRPRITKVVKALKHIESKVDAWSAPFARTSPSTSRRIQRRAGRQERAGPDERLRIAQRPAAPDNAPSSDDIDPLLASFRLRPAHDRRRPSRCPYALGLGFGDSAAHEARVAAIRHAMPQWRRCIRPQARPGAQSQPSDLGRPLHPDPCFSSC